MGGAGVAICIRRNLVARAGVARRFLIMHRSLFFVLLAGAALTAAARGAEQSFSQSIRAEDYAAAGLNKLSPAELERLDALVRAHRSGAPAVTPPVGVASARTASPVNQPAKVVLKPGTQVEYEAVESRIAGEFRGWEPRTVFVLENGQRWQVVGDSRYAGTAVTSPAVKIAPGMLGSWWMTVDGVKQRVKVTPVGGR